MNENLAERQTPSTQGCAWFNSQGFLQIEVAKFLWRIVQRRTKRRSRRSWRAAARKMNLQKPKAEKLINSHCGDCCANLEDVYRLWAFVDQFLDATLWRRRDGDTPPSIKRPQKCKPTKVKSRQRKL
ncbi:hypothetical protein C2S51_002614 [Perilla frutescens var. frutescens]|nr:hypothetical protein C2S51_002614 [Perilla frutescens var. frutescens]